MSTLWTIRINFLLAGVCLIVFASMFYSALPELNGQSAFERLSPIFKVAPYAVIYSFILQLGLGILIAALSVYLFFSKREQHYRYMILGTTCLVLMSVVTGFLFLGLTTIIFALVPLGFACFQLRNLDQWGEL